MAHRRLVREDIRVGARIPQTETGISYLVKHVTSDRSRVTVRYIPAPDSPDPGARFAGKNTYIFTWDGEGYKRGGRYLDAWHPDGSERDRQRSRDVRRFRRPSREQQRQISDKIRVLRHEGYPPKQAIAIAYSMAGVGKRRRT